MRACGALRPWAERAAFTNALVRQHVVSPSIIALQDSPSSKEAATRANALGTALLDFTLFESSDRRRTGSAVDSPTADRPGTDNRPISNLGARPALDKDALRGITLAVKDNFCTVAADAGEAERGLGETTCASAILAGYKSPFESTVVRRWRNHGATLIGKANMDEFGMGSDTSRSTYGPVTNPWSSSNGPAFSAGGSSGGSAAAVAARLCFGALGSDTGGSVRQPAAHCGIVGFKPTYGRLSRHGLVAYASSLDTPGVFATTVEGCAVLFACADGIDEEDSTSVQPLSLRKERRERECDAAAGPLAGITVGVPEEYFVAELDPLIVQAWSHAIDLLENHGAKCVSVSLPNTRHALPAYYVIAPSEASSNLARYDGIEFGPRGASHDSNTGARGGFDVVSATRAELFGAEVRRRIMLGSFCLSRTKSDNFYIQALRIRRLLANDFLSVFAAGVDFLLAPTTPNLPKTLEDVGSRTDPVEEYVSDILTTPASLVGLPAVSVPRLIERADNLFPVGMQLIGSAHSDYRLLAAARLLQVEQLAGPNPILPPSILEADEPNAGRERASK